MFLIWKLRRTRNLNTILTAKIEDIKKQVKEWKAEGLTVGLVPTMGALHAGHASLMKKAKETCDRVVVSAFVNPIQFGPNEDYDKYPRTIEKDKETCQNNDVDILFAPTPSEMYGDSLVNSCGLTNKSLTFVYPPYGLVDKLCGKSRVGHFDGVATVVLKLFNIVQPDFAFFGQKDAQQLIIIMKMVNDLNVPLTIVPCPIVREEDGLALSSRNRYLSEEARTKALTISKAIFAVKDMFEKGETNTKYLLETALATLDKSLDVEYFEFVDMENLESQENINQKTLVATAVKIDNVRLIDNIIIGDNKS